MQLSDGTKPELDGLTSPDFQEQGPEPYSYGAQAGPEPYAYGACHGQPQAGPPPKPPANLVPELSISQWLLVRLLLWIPLVGLVMKVIWAIGDPGEGKETLVNYSRASLIWMLIEGVLTIILWAVFIFWLSFMAAGSTPYI